jgi:ribosomal protein S18 acetylase RimI-like enzyme
MEILQEPLSEELKKKVYEGFHEHSLQKMGVDLLQDPISFIAKINNEIVGTVVVQPFWGALHLKYVWVKEENRGKGFGKKLLEYALSFGKKNDYRFAFVETMNFQAPMFYQKLGFTIDFIRSGYSHETSFYYLSKKLS